MILKDKIFHAQSDRRLIAGDAAEKQMAFYLKREFGADKDLWVIHDLRVEHEGEFAQIDHLVISQWGLFVVESKSVTSSVQINAHGEWLRHFEGKNEGMPSPVLQAEAQGRLLKRLLAAHAHELLGTIMGLRKGFGYCPVMGYVAISDSGIIQRETDLPNVLKADAVAPAIRAWLKNCSVVKELFSLSLEIKPGGWKMSKKEAEAISLFLKGRHTPRTVPKIESKSPSAVAEPHSGPGLLVAGQACPECGQHALVHRSLSRTGSTPRNFLVCVGYPKSCKAIYPLPNTEVPDTTGKSSNPGETAHRAGDACPRCKVGKLVERKGKSTFLGCSNYGNRQQKCSFTDYSYKAELSV